MVIMLGIRTQLNHIMAPKQIICYSNNKLSRSFFQRAVFFIVAYNVSTSSHADGPITSLESSDNTPIRTTLIMPLAEGAAKRIYQDVAEGITSNKTKNFCSDG